MGAIRMREEPDPYRRLEEEFPWEIPGHAPLFPEGPRKEPLHVFRDEETLVLHASVGRAVWHHVPKPRRRSADGGDPLFDCGPKGALTSEGLDLALNALAAYVPPKADGEEVVECRLNVVSRTAWDLHEDFAREVLAHMHPDGEDLTFSELWGWIQSKKPGLSRFL
ncbi:MAG: hypothetical protein M3R38_18605 [Actinomycetota bacterium]|nr:hypothetical protein [Actinomycetota bacterium]